MQLSSLMNSVGEGSSASVDEILESEKAEVLVTDFLCDDIVPDPNQPRSGVNSARVKDIIETLDPKNGESAKIWTPIVIMVLSEEEQALYPDKKAMIVAGERRWMASLECKKVTIPVRFIKKYDKALKVKIQGIENEARENLTVVEAAVQVKNTIDVMPDASMEMIAKTLGSSKSRVSMLAKIAILKNADDEHLYIKKMIDDEKISDVQNCYYILQLHDMYGEELLSPILESYYERNLLNRKELESLKKNGLPFTSLSKDETAESELETTESESTEEQQELPIETEVVSSNLEAKPDEVVSKSSNESNDNDVSSSNSNSEEIPQNDALMKIKQIRASDFCLSATVDDRMVELQLNKVVPAVDGVEYCVIKYVDLEGNKSADAVVEADRIKLLSAYNKKED